MHNELSLQRAIMEDTVRKLQEEIHELKSDQRQKIDSLESKVRKAEIEKAELSAKEQSTREALQQTQQEKSQLEENLTQKLKQARKDFERELEEINHKLAQTEE
jgi:phage-related tail protein